MANCHTRVLREPSRGKKCKKSQKLNSCRGTGQRCGEGGGGCPATGQGNGQQLFRQNY